MKRHVNIFKLIVASMFRDTINAKATQRSIVKTHFKNKTCPYTSIKEVIVEILQTLL